MSMKAIPNALVVTRHESLVEFLRLINLIDDSATVVSHATTEDVAGRHVIGVLPHSLSVMTETFTEVPMVNLPADMRGKELSIDDMRDYAGDPITYKVRHCQ